MAIRIPVTTQEQLSPLGTPNAARIDTSGARVAAQQLGATVDVVARAQERIQQQRNLTMVQQAMVLVGDAERKQTAKWQERRGAGAHGLQDEAISWWSETPLNFTDSLENDAQRALFQQEIDKRRETSLDSLSRFQSQQEYQGLIDASNARINLEVSTAAQNFTDPEAIARARESAINTVDSLVYMQNGGKVEVNVRDAERLKATTKLHVGVINNMNDVSPEQAAAYFKEYKSEIDGTLHDELREKLETGSKIEKAQTLVDELWSKGLRGTKLFDAVREQSHGKYEQDALTIARQRNSDNQAEVDRYTTQRTDSVWAKFDQGGYASLSASDIEHMRRHDTRGLNAMRNLDPQAQVMTDWSTNQELNDQARADPTAFAKVNLNSYRDKLAKPQLDALLSWQDAIKKQQEQNKPNDVATLQQQLSSAIEKYKIKKGENEGKFRDYVTLKVSAAQAAKGRALTLEERDNVIKGAAYEFDLSWRPDREAFDMRPQDYQRIVISAENRTEVEQILRARGIEATDAAVREAYVRLATAGHFD